MSHDVLAVANQFLKLAKANGSQLTSMQLQKLCYFAQGYSLAFLDDELIENRVEAWDYGPVFPALYDAVKRYGSRPIPELIRKNNWSSSDSIRGEVIEGDFSEEEEDLIESIFETYGDFQAFQLSAITHEEGSPWKQVYARAQNVVIPHRVIRKYFRSLDADA